MALFRYWFNSSLVSRFLGYLDALRITVTCGFFIRLVLGIGVVLVGFRRQSIFFQHGQVEGRER